MTTPPAVKEDLVPSEPVVLVEGEPRLAMLRCEDCDQLLQPTRAVCFRCLNSRLRADAVESSGTLYAFTRVHVSAHREVPYAIGYVDLDAGVRILGQLADFDAVSLGDRVALTRDDRRGWVFASTTGEAQ